MDLKEIIGIWKERADNLDYKGQARQDRALEFFMGVHVVQPLPPLFLVCLSVGRKPEEFGEKPGE